MTRTPTADPPGNPPGADRSAKIFDFHTEALVRLRHQLSELGEANEALLDYARGHAGAVLQIHEAVLAALDADGFEHLVHIITQDWVDILGLDAVGLALTAPSQGLRFGNSGLQLVAPDDVAQWFPHDEPVCLRSCETGAGIFGPAAPLIRSEAMIRLSVSLPLPSGVLALGSRQEHCFEGVHGTELLTFLGGVTGRCITRWLSKVP